jgi:hypothetical protein
MPDFMTPQVGAAPPVGLQPPNADASLSALFAGQQPSAPSIDPYTDDAALLKLFKDKQKQCFEGRWVQERIWWRNLLYALGKQWIYFDVKRGAWADKKLQKWVPRPVTNKIADTIDTMRSVFQAVDLSIKCRPMSDNPKDTQTAFIADNLAPALHVEHDMDFRLFEADFWAIATGNAFLHPWFDPRSEHGMLVVPFEKCLQCQAVSAPEQIVAANQTCPTCGGANFQPSVDAQGQPQGHEYPIGRGSTDVCSPFEIGFPGGYTSFPDLPLIIRQRWRTKEWYQTTHPDFAKTLHFDKTTNERSLQMLKALASQSELGASNLGAQTSEAYQSEGITEFELWSKPTRTYPGGLLLRVAGHGGGEKIVRDDVFQPQELPMKTKQGQPVFPWLHYGYNRFGGRIWARSPLDLIIQKQDQINQLDSMMQLGVQRMSNPVWIEPKGSEVKKFTGEPGLVVRYNPLVGNGAKPERIEGANIPTSLLKLREQYLADLESLAGTQDVLKGTKPAGISAFSAMQLLVERAQSRFGPVLNERGKMYSAWFQLALEIERQFGPQERTWAAMGINRRWAFKTFANADLQGTVQIIVEDGSQSPKTNLGKRAAIEQLNNLQMLNPGDPEQLMEIYKTFGQTGLIPSLDVAIQSALSEQSEFEEWAQSPASKPQPTLMPPVQPPLGQQPPRMYGADDAGPAVPPGPGGPPPGPVAPPPPAPSGVSSAPPPVVAPVAASPGSSPVPGMPPPMPEPPKPWEPAGPDGAGPADQLTMMPGAPCPMVVKMWNNHAVHVSEHSKWANSDLIRWLFRSRPDLEQAFTMHLMQHQQMLSLQMAPAPGPNAGPPTAPEGSGIKPAGGPGGGRALRNSNQESGKPGVGQAPPA